MQTARELGVDVVGVSFHVGSAATNPAAFEEAIASADAAFAAGAAHGFDMRLLDIGGGFSSGSFSLQGERSLTGAVARALDRHFPAERGVRIISEPGRYAPPSDFNILLLNQSGTTLRSSIQLGRARAFSPARGESLCCVCCN